MKSVTKCDVAIAGAGPAGAIAAIELAESGLRVVCIDQASMPRLKPCGGLMPAYVAGLTSAKLRPFITHTANSFGFEYDSAQPHQLQVPEGSLWLAERSTFDASLVHAAVSAGRGSVSLLESCRLSHVEETESQVVISTTSGPAVKASALIAADGAASPVARSLNLAPSKPQAAAIDTTVGVSDDVYEHYADRVFFNYYTLPGGYGWVFPKGEGTLSIGVASWAARPPPLKEALARFMAASCLSVSNAGYRAHGHPLPRYDSSRKIATPRTCLTGDAAGLVDPVTGEGIRYAIHSGVLAARTVRAMIADQNSDTPEGVDCLVYQDAVEQELAPALAWQEKFASLPFREAPEFYYRKFIAGGYGSPGYVSAK